MMNKAVSNHLEVGIESNGCDKHPLSDLPTSKGRKRRSLLWSSLMFYYTDRNAYRVSRLFSGTEGESQAKLLDEKWRIMMSNLRKRWTLRRCGSITSYLTAMRMQRLESGKMLVSQAEYDWFIRADVEDYGRLEISMGDGRLSPYLKCIEDDASWTVWRADEQFVTPLAARLCGDAILRQVAYNCRESRNKDDTWYIRVPNVVGRAFQRALNSRVGTMSEDEIKSDTRFANWLRRRWKKNKHQKRRVGKVFDGFDVVTDENAVITNSEMRRALNLATDYWPPVRYEQKSPAIVQSRKFGAAKRTTEISLISDGDEDVDEYGLTPEPGGSSSSGRGDSDYDPKSDLRARRRVTSKSKKKREAEKSARPKRKRREMEDEDERDGDDVGLSSTLVSGGAGGAYDSDVDMDNPKAQPDERLNRVGDADDDDDDDMDGDAIMASAKKKEDDKDGSDKEKDGGLSELTDADFDRAFDI